MSSCSTTSLGALLAVVGEEAEGHLQGIPGGGAHLLGVVEALAHGHRGGTEQAVVQRADGGGGVGLRRGAPSRG